VWNIVCAQAPMKFLSAIPYDAIDLYYFPVIYSETCYVTVIIMAFLNEVALMDLDHIY
jgi:hypothetical protein